MELTIQLSKMVQNVDHPMSTLFETGIETEIHSSWPGTSKTSILVQAGWMALHVPLKNSP